MKIILASLLVITLSGCAAVLPQPSSGSQPRALMLGSLQPSCLFLCFSTATANESEGGTGGFSPSTNSINTVSPSLNVGGGNTVPLVKE